MGMAKDRRGAAIEKLRSMNSDEDDGEESGESPRKWRDTAETGPPDGYDEDEGDDDEEEVETVAESEEVASQGEDLGPLRERFGVETDEELEQLIRTGRDARTMRSTADQRYKEAADLDREAARKQGEVEATLRLIQEGKIDASSLGATDDEYQDPDDVRDREIRSLRESHSNSLRREAERTVKAAISDVMGQKDFEDIRAMPKRVQKQIESDLFHQVMSTQGVDDHNVHERLSEWAQQQQTEWAEAVQPQRLKRLQDKARAEKNSAPSGKGPRGTARSTPKKKAAKKFSDSQGWDSARKRIKTILRGATDVE
jgi:hypothetical protein